MPGVLLGHVGRTAADTLPVLPSARARHRPHVRRGARAVSVESRLDIIVYAKTDDGTDAAIHAIRDLFDDKGWRRLFIEVRIVRELREWSDR